MKVIRELELFNKLDKLGWKYGLSGDDGDTSCDVTMRDEPLLSYAIYMKKDSEEFVLHRNHVRKDGYGFDVFVETPLQTFKSVASLIKRILSDSNSF